MDENTTAGEAPANPVMNAEQAAAWANLEAEAGPDLDPVADHQAQQQEAARAAEEAAHDKGQAEYQEALEMVLGPGFAVLAPAWEVKPEEVQVLASAYAGVLQKYWPGGMGQVGPEFAALAATAMIVAPRFRKPRKLESAGEVRQVSSQAPAGEQAASDTPPPAPAEDGEEVQVSAAAALGGE